MEAVRKRAGALHGGLIFAALRAVGVGLPPLFWPWYLPMRWQGEEVNGDWSRQKCVSFHFTHSTFVK
jgi:hypothetical protein